MSRIGRSDLAKALLDEVESTTNIRAGIAVTSLPKNTKKVIPVKGLESHD